MFVINFDFPVLSPNICFTISSRGLKVLGLPLTLNHLNQKQPISLHLLTFGAVVTDVTALFHWLFSLSLLAYDLLVYRQPHLESDFNVVFRCHFDFSPRKYNIRYISWLLNLPLLL